MGTSPTPAPEAMAPVNHFGRMLGALFSPRATFEDIARRPSWVAPVILLTVISLAGVVVFTQRVGWERVMQQQIERNPRASARLAELSPEQRQQALARNAQIYKVIGYGIGVVGSLVVVAVVAVVLMGLINLLCGAGVNYRTSMGIVAHAYMPSVIAGLLGILVLFLRDPETVDVEHLVASNVGAFLSSDSPRWLISLASSLDLFAFARIALLGIGFASASPRKVSVGKALAIVLGAYAIFVFLAAGLAAVFS